MAETMAAALIYAGMASEVSTVAAAGTTASAAAASAALGTVSFGSVMSTLGVVGGVVSAAGSVIGGMQQADATERNAKVQVAQLQMEQAQAEKDSSEQALDNVRQLRRTIASNNALYGSTGTSLNGGTSMSVTEANQSEAARQLTLIRDQSSLTKAGYSSQIDSTLSNASTTSDYLRSSGVWKAAGTLMDTASRYSKRG